MSNKKVRDILLIIIVVIIVVLFAVILLIGNKNNKVETIGFILPGDRNEKGFNNTHYEAILAACEKLNINVEIYDNVSDKTSEEVISIVDSLNKKNVKLVILCSLGYVEILGDDFAKYPNMTFFGLADITSNGNYHSYFARMYQSRFLSGIIAGLATENNSIGFVAAMDNCEVRRSINAFALGVKKVNPDATVYVTWTNSWNDKEVEIANAKKLIDEAGVDAITYHANTSNVVDVAEEAGIYSICYNTSVDEKYSSNVLTSTAADWDLMYEQIVKDYFQNGEATKGSYWLGIENEAIVLENYSDKVTDEMKAVINEEVEKIRNGRDVFSNKIIDNEGNVRCEEGESFTDDYLMTKFDWFVDGVVVYE